MIQESILASQVPTAKTADFGKIRSDNYFMGHSYVVMFYEQFFKHTLI